jgi:uncharacterized membrane protein
MTAWTDKRMEGTIGALLRIGVVTSAAVVLAGGICYLLRHQHERPEYRTFHAEPAVYRNISGIVTGVARWDCAAVIQLGLLLLIATPVARVAFSMVAFALERDRTYVLATIVVLIVLSYGLFGPR